MAPVKKKQTTPASPPSVRTLSQAVQQRVHSHHAYVVSSPTHTVEELKNIAYTYVDFSHVLPEDTHTFTFLEGSVDEVRALQERAARALRGETALFIIQSVTLSAQAQNALLKLFEDGALHACFFVSVPSVRALLPTMLSRVSIVEIPASEYVQAIAVAQKILTAELYERLTLIEFLYDASEEERASFMAVLVAACERAYANKKITDKELARALHTCVKTKKYLTMQGSMKKMLLEAYVLVLPVVKG
jgi:DNA polymerase III delta prime subunit